MTKNRTIILTIIAIALIGWLVLQNFMKKEDKQPAHTKAVTEQPAKK